MDKSSEVETLIDKAAKADKSEDAIRFSQAACNAANALCSLAQWRRLSLDPSDKKV